jgi:predicted amidophosphoribosyltransferase
LEKYFPQHVKHNKSQQLYYFAKKSERGENIHNKKQFIYGLSDLISRRILRSKINYDAIVPVPSHDGGVSYPLDVSTTVIGETTPLRRHHILKRSQTTGQQKAQNTRIERYKNVADSLGVDVDLNGDQIILIDDICTSGATLNYAAKALYNAGAEDVTGIVYGTTAKRGNTMSIEGPGATIEDLRLAFGGGAE